MFNLPIKKIPFTKVIKIGTAFFKKNSADILTATAVGGVVFTGVMVYRGTLNAEKYINGMIDENASDDTRKVVRVKSFKYYIPAAISAAGTIACIVGANAINHKRIAGLAAACALAETTLQENRDKIKELLGEKELKLLDEEMAKDEIKNAIESTETKRYDLNDGDIWFVIPKTGIVVKTSANHVIKTLNKFNWEINECHWACYARFVELMTENSKDPVFIPDDLYEIGYNDKQTGLMDFKMQWLSTPDDNERYATMVLTNRPIADYMAIY